MVSSVKKPKKVVLCTYPSIYSSLILQILLSSRQVEIVSIVSSDKILTGRRLDTLRMIKKTGLCYSTYLWIITTFFTLLPFKKLPSIKSIGKKRCIPILSTKDINSQKTQNQIKANTPDIILCAHFNQLLHMESSLFKKTPCINIHPSFLPQNKGVDPVFFHFLRRQELTGSTIHEISADVDGGNIIKQKEYISPKSATIFDVTIALFTQGTQLFLESLDEGRTSTKQLATGNYDSWPTAKEGCSLFLKYINLWCFFQAVYRLNN